MIICDECKHLVIRNNEFVCDKYEVLLLNGFAMKDFSEQKECKPEES